MSRKIILFISWKLLQFFVQSIDYSGIKILHSATKYLRLII